MNFTDAQVELLAHLIHEHFRSQAAGGSETGLAFEALPEELQDANRAAARAIPGHLDALGHRLVPAADAVSSIRRWSSDDLECLARREHDRWVTQTLARGYRYGTARDDVLRTHPDLVSWRDLDEAARDKDRALISDIPDLVAAIDLAIVAQPYADY